ncbi:uncharacterized protein RHOBADRAFT_37877 [Rhodotorula graminis WP1]|uniref:Mannose-P-dolichol utilization defect 1 protein homolog n=1 Tax=Rhodotorula graminis (strain WP1) TaxID=578459 RepID=A0A0P9IW46_RHOGW|nr:uncharacterized protein RHOBADRAFT_37877 [Rhodotorula graminis WP1]KPV74015.1 hypothetical protein RHOBADRAFT_37877 [Rhodotorula graminis WP1]
MAALQPLTRNLPGIVRDPLVALLGQECYTTLVWNTDLADTRCLKLALSKGLGLGMVAGGAILKVPQILTVVNSGSARGLSLSSYVLDTAATAITVAYNLRSGFPFSTYGEMVFLLAQNAVLITLITSYSARPTVPRLVPLALFFSTLAYALSSTAIVAPPTLAWLQTLTIPISLSSKLPQIVSNARAGSTGQLSAFLVFNSLAGCLARVFTTRTETADPVLLWGFALGALLNGVLALQMLVYRNKVDVEVFDKRPDGRLEQAHVGATGVDRREVPAVAAAAAPSGGLATPVKQVAGAGAAKQSPASAGGSARRYVRKLD